MLAEQSGRSSAAAHNREHARFAATFSFRYRFLYRLSLQSPENLLKHRVLRGSSEHRFQSHDLRRTTRTGLARLGCPFEIGESILGHRLPRVAGVYNVNTCADEMRNWLNRWAEHVAGIVAPRAKPARAKRRLAWFYGLTGTPTEHW